MKTDIDLRGFNLKIQKALSYLDESQILALVGFDLQKYITDTFDKEGRGLWAPHRPNTQAARPGGKLLQDTGELKRSFYFRVTPPIVTVGSPLQKARWHHLGTKPYTILPKKAGGWLSFMTTRGRVFRRSVKHPGLPKRPLIPTKAVGQQVAIMSIESVVKKMKADVNGTR